MEIKSFLSKLITSNTGMLTHTLGDFTDAEMFTRPCPGANHAAWQVGHLISVEAGVQRTLALAPAVALPAGFDEAYNMKANQNDDPAKFAPVNTKAELLALFTKVRAGTVAWVEAATPEQLDGPSPEKYRGWAAVLADLAAGQVGHATMHIGQFQVIRRKLGKPVLF